MDLSNGQLVNIHLFDSMKPSNVGNNFNPKTYYVTPDQDLPSEERGSLFKLWSVFNDALQQPTLRPCKLGDKKYLMGIPLETYRNHLSWGGRRYPLTTINNKTFAIPYIDTNNNINGNGIKFEPEKTDIVWWFMNKAPSSNYYCYTMFLFNEPTGLYIYLETKYKETTGGNNDGWINIPYISFVVTADEYNNGKMPYDIHFNGITGGLCIIARDRVNDVPLRENPFYDLVRIGHTEKALFINTIDGHKGTSPANWSMQVSHDPSGAYHSFRSYGKLLNVNDHSIVKPPKKWY